MSSLTTSPQPSLFLSLVARGVGFTPGDPGASCLAVVYTIHVLISKLLIIFISFLFYLHVCVSLCVCHMCVNTHGGHRGLDPLECKLECGCEPPDIGAENQSWVLSQSSKSPSSLNVVSSISPWFLNVHY